MDARREELVIVFIELWYSVRVPATEHPSAIKLRSSFGNDFNQVPCGRVDAPLYLGFSNGRRTGGTNHS